MGQHDEVDFCAVSIARRIAITDSGQECPITDMFDKDGDKTSDEDDAVIIVVQVSSECWAVIDMDEFVDTALN